MAGETAEPAGDDEKPVSRKEMLEWQTKLDKAFTTVSERLEQIQSSAKPDTKEAEALKTQLAELAADRDRLKAELAEATKPKEPEPAPPPKEPEPKPRTSRQPKKGEEGHPDQRTPRSGKKGWI